MIKKKITLLFTNTLKIYTDWYFFLTLLIFISIGSMFVMPYYCRGLPKSDYWIICSFGISSLVINIYIRCLIESVYNRKMGIPISSTTIFLFGIFHEQAKKNNGADDFFSVLVGLFWNFIFTFFLYLLLIIAKKNNWQIEVLVAIKCTCIINSVLLIVNLFPCYPLDCGKIFKIFLNVVLKCESLSYRIILSIGTVLSLLIVLAGILMVYYGMVIGGICIVLSGLAIRRAATQSTQQFLLGKMLEVITNKMIIQTNSLRVPSDIDVSDFVSKYIYTLNYNSYSVINYEQRVIGNITANTVMETPLSCWKTTTLGELVSNYNCIPVISQDAQIKNTLAVMMKTGSSICNIVDSNSTNRIVGFVSIENMLMTILKMFINAQKTIP